MRVLMCLMVMVMNMNLSEAIKLLDAVSNFNFEGFKKKPAFCICDNQKDGYSISIKASLVNDEYRNYLEKIVKSCKLGIRKSEGCLIIYGYLDPSCSL
jgi:hypothetical protein